MNNASVTQLSFGCEDKDNKDKNIFERKSVFERFSSDFRSNGSASILVSQPVKWSSNA